MIFKGWYTIKPKQPTHQQLSTKNVFKKNKFWMLKVSISELWKFVFNSKIV